MVSAIEINGFYDRKKCSLQSLEMLSAIEKINALYNRKKIVRNALCNRNKCSLLSKKKCSLQSPEMLSTIEKDAIHILIVRKALCNRNKCSLKSKKNTLCNRKPFLLQSRKMIYAIERNTFCSRMRCPYQPNLRYFCDLRSKSAI